MGTYTAVHTCNFLFSYHFSIPINSHTLCSPIVANHNEIHLYNFRFAVLGFGKNIAGSTQTAVSFGKYFAGSTQTAVGTIKYSKSAKVLGN